MQVQCCCEEAILESVERCVERERERDGEGEGEGERGREGLLRSTVASTQALAWFGQFTSSMYLFLVINTVVVSKEA